MDQRREKIDVNKGLRLKKGYKMIRGIGGGQKIINVDN